MKRGWGALLVIMLFAPATRADEVCGGLETLPLEGKPVDLLRGRLRATSSVPSGEIDGAAMKPRPSCRAPVRRSKSSGRRGAIHFA